MKENIGSFFTFLLYALLTVGFVGGEFHSFKKHGAGDGMMGVIFFPWGIYRGAESLWHDDYSGVDWDKRLEKDMRMCYYFISEANNKEISQLQFSDDMEKFSSKISKYPLMILMVEAAFGPLLRLWKLRFGCCTYIAVAAR